MSDKAKEIKEMGKFDEPFKDGTYTPAYNKDSLHEATKEMKEYNKNVRFKNKKKNDKKLSAAY